MKPGNVTHAGCCFLLILFLIQTSGHAQERMREVGLRTTNFNDYGAVYKWQKSEGIFWRMTVATLNFRVDNEPGRASAGIGVMFGNEKRKLLADRTEFLQGIQYQVQSSYSDFFEIESALDFTVAAGVGWLLGLQYLISDKFNAGIEVVPSILARYRYSDNSFALLGAADLTNVTLFATYRFSSPQRVRSTE